MEANGCTSKVGPNFQDYVVGVMAEVQALSKELGNEIVSDRIFGSILTY